MSSIVNAKEFDYTSIIAISNRNNQNKTIHIYPVILCLETFNLHHNLLPYNDKLQSLEI